MPTRAASAAAPRGLKEHIIVGSLKLAALISIAVTAGIVFILVEEAYHFFSHVSPLEFLGGTRWAPLLEPRSFGVLPLIVGTLLVTVIALLVAVPFGVGSAIYLSEYASSRVRSFFKPVLEILAGIPSIVYGFFALTTITPFLRSDFLQPLLQPLFKFIGYIDFLSLLGDGERLYIEQVEIFNAASAGIVVGIMILPMIASISDDAFSAVSKSLRNGAYALGATRSETVLGVVLPSAISGVTASIVLAFSRAIGETMAVTLAAGMLPRLTLNPFVSIETMTAYIVQVSLGDTPRDSIEYQTIFAVGLVLFAITLGANIIANRTVARIREVGE